MKDIGFTVSGSPSRMITTQRNGVRYAEGLSSSKLHRELSAFTDGVTEQVFKDAWEPIQRKGRISMKKGGVWHKSTWPLASHQVLKKPFKWPWQDLYTVTDADGIKRSMPQLDVQQHNLEQNTLAGLLHAKRQAIQSTQKVMHGIQQLPDDVCLNDIQFTNTYHVGTKKLKLTFTTPQVPEQVLESAPDVLAYWNAIAQYVVVPQRVEAFNVWAGLTQQLANFKQLYSTALPESSIVPAEQRIDLNSSEGINLALLEKIEALESEIARLKQNPMSRLLLPFRNPKD
jgi:hypothetical protein